MRSEWLKNRENEKCPTQLRYARRGIVTEEMRHIAEIEKIEPELVRSEVERGRMIIPANIHHPNLIPMAIGITSTCKINANIGNSALTSDVDEELEKLHVAVHYGADTVMDLSTGGDIPQIRKAILAQSPVPIGTVPIYEALTRVRSVYDLTVDGMLEVIEEQAVQGVDYMTIHAGLLREFVPLTKNPLPASSAAAAPSSRNGWNIIARRTFSTSGSTTSAKYFRNTMSRFPSGTACARAAWLTPATRRSSRNSVFSES